MYNNFVLNPPIIRAFSPGSVTLVFSTGAGTNDSEVNFDYLYVYQMRFLFFLNSSLVLH